jgi:hypothetical protein
MTRSIGNFSEGRIKEARVPTDSVQSDEQVFAHRRLHYVSPGSSLESFPNHRGRVVLTHYEHFRARHLLADESRSLQTIQGRHADVHNYDIGLQLPRLFERIVPVRRFATHIVA